MKTLLVRNKGYSWTSEGGDSFKGYFQYADNDTPYRGLSAISELAAIQSLSDLVAFLKRIDGVFSIVLQRGDRTLFAVDRARSMPLYYSTDGEILSDSSETAREGLHIEKQNIDISAGIEFYTTRFVSGEDTIYSQIKQLNGGMCGQISPAGIVTSTYYFHCSERKPDSHNEIKQLLTERAEQMMRRILAVVGDRPIVLSMSGGYDSRFIGCMLKRCGAKDVSCYTYGKASSFEIQQSKKNAEALGFRWKCVEHPDHSVLDMLGAGGKEYFEYCTDHDYPIYLQNFIAVKELHESGWIKPRSVFLTGLCGDMPTGQYILASDEMDGIEYSADGCARYLRNLAQESYQVIEPYGEELFQKVHKRIKALPFEVKDYQSFWSAVDCITTLDIHSRAFLHMNRVHEFFGYEWLLPYWDMQLLNTWYAVPAELRAEQAMYEDWLLNDICAPYGLGTKKNRNLIAKDPLVAKLKRNVGAGMQWMALRIGVPIRRSFDINNVAVTEPVLFQRLSYRGKINYRHASSTLLLIRYVMEQRYGPEAVKRICCYLA